MTDHDLRWAWRDVDAPAASVWTLLADTTWWPGWGPSVRAVEPADGRVTPGLRGRVQTPVGLWVPFVIDDVTEGRSWRWTVAGIIATDHAVEEVGRSSSRVGIAVPRLARPYLVVCRVALGRIARLARTVDARSDG